MLRPLLLSCCDQIAAAAAAALVLSIDDLDLLDQMSHGRFPAMRGVGAGQRHRDDQGNTMIHVKHLCVGGDPLHRVVDGQIKGLDIGFHMSPIEITNPGFGR